MDISIDELLSSDFGEDIDFLTSSSSEDESCTELCCCKDVKKNEVTSNENGFGMMESRIEPYASTLSDLDFRKKFRVSRNTFQKIVELCGSQFFSSIDNLCEQIAPVDAVYILLWYLGNLETFQEMSKLFEIDKTCIWNIINSGITYLSKNMKHYIEWPKSYEYPELSESFQKICNLKDVIGVIGTTYIKIQTPKDHSEDFSSSSYLTMQGIFSSNNKFIDVFLCDDVKPTNIWKKSPISLDANFGLFEKGFVLGSNAYHGVNGLVSSFPKNKSLTSEQRKFNAYIKKSLKITNNSFSYLKGRFQRLQHELENKSLAFTVKSIQTACVLHNVCIDAEDDCEFAFYEKEYALESSYNLKSDDNETPRLFKSFLDSLNMLD